MKLNKEKILVTGGAGFIGSNLVDELITQGYKVTVLDNLSLGKKEHLNKKSNFFNRDLRSFNSIKPLFKGIDYVFHVAAYPRVQLSIKNPLDSFEHNALATFNVFLAAKEVGVKKIIYSTSASTYGNQSESPLREDMISSPENPYGLYKHMGESMALMFNKVFKIPTVCLRYFNVYGERQSHEGSYASAIGIFLRQRNNNQHLTVVGSGEQRRDFTYVGDVVNANILAMKKVKANGQVINIGAGNSYSINEMANLISNKIKYLPQRSGEIKNSLADNTKAKKLLGWKPKVQLKDWIKSLK